MIISIKIMIAIFIAFLALIMLHTSWKLNRYVLFLSFYLFISAFGIIFYDMLVRGGTPEVFLMMLSTFKFLFLLSGPFFYFFVRGMLDNNYHFNGKELMHLIPFLLCFILSTPYFLSPLNDKYEYAYEAMGNLPYFMKSTVFVVPNWLAVLLCSIHSIAYIVVSFFVIYRMNNKKRSELKSQYQRQYKRNYFWFLSISLLALVLSLFHIGLSLSFVHGKAYFGLYNSTFNHPFVFETLVLIIIIPLLYLLNPGILYAYPAMLRLNPLVKEGKFKLEENRNYIVLEYLDRSLVYNNYFVKLSEKIYSHTTENKLYLEPDFNIHKLSQLLSVPVQHIHFCVRYIHGLTCEKIIDSMRISYFLDKFSIVENQVDIEILVLQSGFSHYKDFLKKFKNHQGVTFDDWYASNI